MKRAVARVGDRPVIGCVEVAEGPLERMQGLLGRSSLGPDRAMFLEPCASIHTLAMQFTLDLVFLDRRRHVVEIVRGVKPNRVAWGARGAHGVLELEAGWLADGLIKPGDAIELAYGEPEASMAR